MCRETLFVIRTEHPGAQHGITTTSSRRNTDLDAHPLRHASVTPAATKEEQAQHPPRFILSSMPNAFRGSRPYSHETRKIGLKTFYLPCGRRVYLGGTLRRDQLGKILFGLAQADHVD